MKYLIITVFSSLLLGSCQDKTAVVCSEMTLQSPKLVLVVGQSNTHAGCGLDEVLDAPMSGIYQLGRFENNNCVILATEPLDHHTKVAGYIGFALTFGKLLHQHWQEEEKIIIVPCGYGGTGFKDNNWNKSNRLYQDAVNRIHSLKESYPDCSVSAILWHQGETDVILANEHYQDNLDQFIHDLRNDIGDQTIPFILGGMVPYWVDQASDRQAFQAIIAETPQRVLNVGYADPLQPFIIEKSDNAIDEIHYDAAGQRELGQRYFNQFLLLTE